MTISARPLTELITQAGPRLPLLPPVPGESVLVSGITQDSREVRPGYVFAAIQGAQYNGEDYIPQAITAGAAAILCRPDAAPERSDTPVLLTEQPRQALSMLAGALYLPDPPQVTAVTGTNGKTSTAEFIRQFQELLGYPALSIGTMGVRSQQALDELPEMAENTSPEPVAFVRLLAEAKRQGIAHVACEASSHGLDQCRLDGIRPDVAVFTSFTQDHLDYHGDMEAYFAAKARLFRELLNDGGQAVCCTDQPDIAALASELALEGKQVWRYGSPDGGSVDVAIEQIIATSHGQHVGINAAGERYTLSLPFHGAFQAYNVMAAMLAVSVQTQTPLADLVALCQRLQPIRGRLELVGTNVAGAPVLIDYAHTPDALERALTSLRPATRNKLHVVFGCGGERDTGKRATMGEIAARLADVTTITDDNPRSEDPGQIRAAILTHCPGAYEMAERAQAIRDAISRLQDGDTLLIAGKGHETYQIIGNERLPFDDAEIVRETLREVDAS